MSLCDNCIHDEVCGLEANHDDGLIFCADMIPNVTPKQRMGHWKEEYIGGAYEVCSECHFRITKAYLMFNYCPNCGAKMEEHS